MNEKLQNIPAEMRALNQWVVCKANTKIPYQTDGQPASSTDPSTWTTFDDAVAVLGGWTYTNIGFVLTADDPYVIIDYDEECPPEVIEKFDTYTEYSRSGRGVHIIMRGRFDGQKRKGKVECYQDNRYMIMTGDVVLDREIGDRQAELDEWRTDHNLDVVEEERPASAPTATSIVGDAYDVLQRMERAGNTEQVLQLYHNGYPAGADKSQEDARLMESLYFYSGGNKDLVMELMWSSALRREKWTANKKYLGEYTWNRVSGGPVWEPIENNWVDEMVTLSKDACGAKAVVVKTDVEPVKTNMLTPDQYSPNGMGALSHICDIFNQTAPRPIDSFAMHTALATLGIYLARRFRTASGNYTSLYWGVIAPTGGGKGHTTKVIDYVMRELDPLLTDRIKGSGYTSDSAIFSTLQGAPSHLGIIDELGDYIMGSRNKNNHTAQSQWRVLKEAWCNSGTLRPKNYSDHTQRSTTKAQMPCVCPNISLFGCSTVSQFWESLTINDGADGFLNRWLIYTDEKPSMLKMDIVHINDVSLPQELVEWHRAICSRSPIKMMAGDEETLIRQDANLMPDDVVIQWGAGCQKAFYDYHTTVVEATRKDQLTYDMLQRAGQMARSLALIVELSKDPMAESITIDSAMWAIQYVHTVLTQMAVYAKRNIAGNEEEALSLKMLNAIREAGPNGMTKKDLQKLKLKEFTANNFKHAMPRLVESGLVVCDTRETGGKGRNPMVFISSEFVETEQ